VNMEKALLTLVAAATPMLFAPEVGFGPCPLLLPFSPTLPGIFLL